MTEQEPISPGPEVSPQTAYILSKSVQELAKELYTHADPQYVGETDGQFMIFTDQKYLGELTEWDGKFFSFTEHASRSRLNPDSEITDMGVCIQLVRENAESRSSLPEGTYMLVSFFASKVGLESGHIFTKWVALRTEGAPLVEEWITDNKYSNRSSIRAWRPLTEPEARDLISDMTEFSNNLRAYLENNQALLFSE